MSARMSTLVEMGALVRSRPGLDTPAEQVAAWYERKAVLLGHIAAETGDIESLRLSRLAHAHAVSLLAGRAVTGGRPTRGTGFGAAVAA